MCKLTYRIGRKRSPLLVYVLQELCALNTFYVCQNDTNKALCDLNVTCFLKYNLAMLTHDCVSSASVFIYTVNADPEYESMQCVPRDVRLWAVKNVGTSDAAALNELEFTTKSINKDAYNSRAWSHRQWVFQTFGGDWVDEDELAYCAKILKEDTYNSFAWDQRHFIVITRWMQKIDEAETKMDFDLAENLVKCFEGKRSREVDYAVEVVEAEPENQYPWSHIRGLYNLYAMSLTCDLSVRRAILRVLEDERDRVRALKVGGIMDGRVASSMNARGIINALNMLLELMHHGFYKLIRKEEGKEFVDVIYYLCPDTCPSEEFRFMDKIFEIMERMEGTLTDCGISWINVGDRVFIQGFNCIDLETDGSDNETDVLDTVDSGCVN